MIVVDASAMVDLLLDVAPAADAIRGRLASDPSGIAAPHLIDAEVGQVLRRFVLRGEVSEDRALAALDDLADFPIARHAHAPFARRAFELRENATFYDALYLALAEALAAPLVTRDEALLGIPGATARVELV